MKSTMDHLTAMVDDYRQVNVQNAIVQCAMSIDAATPNCPEKSAGMRKLLEARECFLRAATEEFSGEG